MYRIFCSTSLVMKSNFIVPSSRLLSATSSRLAATTNTEQNLPPQATFTKLSLGTAEDFKRAQFHFAKQASPQAIADRMLSLVEGLRGVSVGTVVDLYEHSLQTASRALADGADEELVVVALLHDVGELLAPACHGEIAAGMLRPFISPRAHWILSHHEIFQAYYYGDAMNIDKNIRDRFKDHPYYGACEEFCGRYDETSFDLAYKSLPLSEFRPMLIRILEKKPYSLQGQLQDKLNSAKAALGVYDFDEWNEKNQ